jgi:hypothetical protein
MIMMRGVVDSRGEAQSVVAGSSVVVVAYVALGEQQNAHALGAAVSADGQGQLGGKEEDRAELRQTLPAQVRSDHEREHLPCREHGHDQAEPQRELDRHLGRACLREHREEGTVADAGQHPPGGRQPHPQQEDHQDRGDGKAHRHGAARQPAAERGAGPGAGGDHDAVGHRQNLGGAQGA